MVANCTNNLMVEFMEVRRGSSKKMDVRKCCFTQRSQTLTHTHTNRTEQCQIHNEKINIGGTKLND